MNKIEFKWGVTMYEVQTNVSDKKHIVLPNRKVLKVKTRWDGMNGLIIKKLEEVHNPLQHAPLGEIAEHFDNAVIACTVA